MIPVDILSGCNVLIGLRHMSFGLRIISVPGGNILCSCVDDDSEMNTFPTFRLPTLFPKVEREDGCRTSVERETAETKRCFYRHFHMCLSFGDVKLPPWIAETCVPYDLEDRLVCGRCVCHHTFSVFHINWLVYSVLDKPHSEKGQKRREKTSCIWMICSCFVVTLLHCVHTIFI